MRARIRWKLIRLLRRRLRELKMFAWLDRSRRKYRVAAQRAEILAKRYRKFADGFTILVTAHNQTWTHGLRNGWVSAPEPFQ